MNITWSAVSDVGQVRDRNEDYYLADDNLHLYIVCDGMGGHAAGDLASKTAAASVQRYLRANREIIAEFSPGNSIKQREELSALITKAIQHACHDVFDLSKSTDNKGMGTTLTMMLIVSHKAIMGHVGDSRLYVSRGQATHQLSHDHNMVAELISRGKPKEQVMRSVQSQFLTRAVGTQANVAVDTLVFDIIPGDTFLMCSDGLSNYFLDTELASILTETKLNPLALIKQANARGGKDNITALLVRAEEENASAEARARANEITLRLGALRQVFLFRDLDYEGLIRILGKVTVEKYETGQEIIFSGDITDKLYIILEGWVRVERNGESVGTLNCGEHFGEMTFFNDKQREATLIAIESTRVLVFARKQLEEFYYDHPRFAVTLLKAFTSRLSEPLDDTNEQYLYVD